MTLFWLLLSPVFALELELKGEATTLDGKKKLYFEHHQVTLDSDGLNERIKTTYRTPDGKIFATMDTNFSKDPLVPDIVFKDSRFDRTEELLLSEDGKTLTLRRQSQGQKLQEKKLSREVSMVAGQGFDNFVKKNFDKLRKSTVPLEFVVLPQMDSFGFQGLSKGSPREGIQTFGLKIKSFFASFFVNEIQVGYDQTTKRLVTYRGLSNLESDAGKSQNVLIKYESGIKK